MLRIDVRYEKPDGYYEVGLVDNDPEEDALHPTLFVGGYYTTPEDREWLEHQIQAIIEMSRKTRKVK